MELVIRGLGMALLEGQQLLEALRGGGRDEVKCHSILIT